MRVTRDTCVAGAVLAVPTLWLAGRAGGLGVVAGVLLAATNFLWLARRASLAGPASSTALWALASSVRLLAVGVACAVLFKLELIHPVGLVAGLTVLPVAVIVQGLRAARQDT